MLFDVHLSIWLQDWIGQSIGRELAIICARWIVYFMPPALLVLGTFYPLGRRIRHGIVEAGWATLVAVAASLCLEHVFHRPRPFVAHSEIVAWVPGPALYSFPSSHAAGMFAVAGVLWVADRRLGAVAFFLATVVSFGRVVVGVHYFTDVVAGACLGLFVAWFIRWAHGYLARMSLRSS